MSSYRLTLRADADIEQIIRTSLAQWGLARTEAYVMGLHEAFQRLAEHPGLGRDASEVRAGCLRHDAARHTVFYRVAEDGVLVLRVLHARMDARRHL